MPNRILSLHQLSLRDADPLQLVQIAADAGFGHVTVFLNPPAPQLDIFPRLQDGPPTEAFREALRQSGVRVHSIEALPFSGRTDPADYLPVLDQAAAIGAARLTALVYDRDHARASDRISQCCDQAAARGIEISIEFMAFSSLPTLAEAAAFVRNSGHPSLNLLVDPLHLTRTQGQVVDLPGVGDCIGALQLCDAMVTPPADLFREAVEDREIPGQGELPLHEFLASTDPALPVDVEVPMLRLQKQGVSPQDRALLLRQAVRAYGL